MKNNRLIKILLLLNLFILPVSLSAEGYGEITGTVVDKTTGEPLPFANVMIVSTTLGAATDDEGRFRIGQVPAGTYAVQVKYMGYQYVTIENVRVSLNRITSLEFELPSETLTTLEVIVQAVKPPVDVEVSSSAQMINSVDVQNIPIVTNVKDLVALQSGVVKDGKDVHIRGGRSDEVLYLIDGVPARNPITGVSSTEIDINQIEEVEILTGGFDAEYGNANSGVINIITKSGRDNFTADVVMKTDEPFGKGVSTNYDYGYLGLSGPVPLLSNSGFTLSGRYEVDDTYYKIGGGYGHTKFLGINISDRQYGSYGIMGQLNYKPWQSLRIKLSGNFDKYTNKEFDWAWYKIPEGLPVTKSYNNKFTSIISHTLSKETYYDISLSYQKGEQETSLLGIDSPIDAFGYTTNYYTYDGKLIPQNEIEDMLRNNPSLIDFSLTNSKYRRPTIISDNDGDGFYDEGENTDFYRNKYETFDISFDFTYFTGIHKFKAGFEGTYNKIELLEIEDYGSFYPERDTIPGAWPQYGDTRWYYNDSYWSGAFFLQDRIEYAGMFLNLGLRADIYAHGDIIEDKDFIAQYNLATGKNIDKFDKYKMVLSPRIGLAIPANKSTKIFFNYGYFTQAPSVEQLYRDPFLTSVVGNPDLDIRKTVNYEVGMETEFVSNYVLKVKIYGGDKSGDIGYVETETTPTRSLYENTGFGSSRGFEVELRKTFTDFFAFTTSYTYLLARGFDLTALEDYETGSTVPPSVREQRVSWDKNHGFKTMINFEVPESQNLEVLGLNISDIGAYFVFTGYLGRPYTPVIPGASYVEVYSKDGSGEAYLDATFFKGFKLFGCRNVIFLEVENLLGIRNVNLGSGFNARTGEVYNFGDLEGTSNKYLTNQQIKFLRANAAYSKDTTIRLGYKLYIK